MSAQDEDELIRRYREASAQEDARPGTHVRDAVRAHAQMMRGAASASASTSTSSTTTAEVPRQGHQAAAAAGRAAANQSRWKISALATVALAGLTGLLMLQFERGTQEERDIAFGQRPAPAPAPAPVALPTPPAAAPSTVKPSALPSPEPQAAAESSADQPMAAPASSPPPSPPPAPAAPAQQRRPAAQPLPAPAPAPAAPMADSGTGPAGTASAQSGFPASVPPGREETPTKPSIAPRADTSERERAALQAGSSAERAARLPQPPAPAAAARSLPGAESANAQAASPATEAKRAMRVSPDSGWWDAARAGNTTQLEQLLTTQGVPIDTRDAAGRTALMLAARNGQTATVRKLLEWGAHPALADHDGLTAAQQARQQGHSRTADLLEAAAR